MACAAMLLVACQPDLTDVPTTECASGRKWVGGNNGSPSMHPGRDCKECHDFLVAGTVYPEAGLDDPNDCAGLSGVSVLLEDASGKMFSLETNEAGNFWLSRGHGPLDFPLRLHAEAGEERRDMALLADTGRCASCHTAVGANGALGRIIMP